MRVLSRSFGKPLVRMFIVGLAVFVLTMAVYSWESTGKGDVDVTHTAIGVPHWLAVTQYKAPGPHAPTDPHLLLEAENHRADWRVRPLFLLASVVGSFLLGAVVYGLGIVLNRSGTGNNRCRVMQSYVFGFVAAIAVGAIIPTDP